MSLQVRLQGLVLGLASGYAAYAMTCREVWSCFEGIQSGVEEVHARINPSFYPPPRPGSEEEHSWLGTRREDVGVAPHTERTFKASWNNNVRTIFATLVGHVPEPPKPVVTAESVATSTTVKSQSPQPISSTPSPSPSPAAVAAVAVPVVVAIPIPQTTPSPSAESTTPSVPPSTQAQQVSE